MNRLYKNRFMLCVICSVFLTIVILTTSMVMATNNTQNVVNVTNSCSNDSTENITDNQLDELAGRLRATFKKTYTFDIDEFDVISGQALKVIYERNLEVEGDSKDYSLTICGADIENYANDMDLLVSFKKTKKGYEVKRKNDEALPGKVTLNIKNKEYRGKYIYIYNKSLDKYLLLSDKNVSKIEIDSGEKYLITNNRLYEYKINYKVIMYVGIGIGVLVLIYILIKKKYWFW